MIPSDPGIIRSIIDDAYVMAIRHLGHPPRDPAWFRHLVAEEVFLRLRDVPPLSRPDPPTDP